MEKLNPEPGYPFNVGVKDTPRGTDIMIYLTKAQLDKLLIYTCAGIYNEELLTKYGIYKIGIEIIE